jgi:Domain of unknown function (DUF5666)
MTFIKPYSRYKTAIAASLCAMFLNGCGGDLVAVAPGGGGTGSVPPDDRVFVAVGPVASVNPLTVNGITFNSAATTITIEAGDDDGKGLQVGMVARVNARTADNGAAIQALAVSTGSELRGPIININAKTMTFESLGVLVELDSATQFDGFANGIESMGANDFVQVHGFPSGDNRIRATLVKKRTASAIVKLTANVGSEACRQCQPGSDDFPLAGFVVQPQAGVRAPDATTGPGSLVKVSGELSTTPGILVAREVDIYRVAAAPEDGSRMTIRGIFSGELRDEKFTVSGLPIRVTATTVIVDPSKFGNPLSAGNLLEIAGDVSKGEVNALEVLRK